MLGYLYAGMFVCWDVCMLGCLYVGMFVGVLLIAVCNKHFLSYLLQQHKMAAAVTDIFMHFSFDILTSNISNILLQNQVTTYSVNLSLHCSKGTIFKSLGRITY